MTTEKIDTTADGPAPAAAQVGAKGLADPTALAFAAVGLPFGIISLSLTGAVTPDLSTIVLPLALTYGAIGLLISGIVAFKLGDVFGAFTYSTLSAFFFSFAMFQLFLAVNVTSFQAGGQGTALAIFVGGWAVIVTHLMLLSFTYPRLFNVIFIAVWIALILLAIGFAGNDGVLKIGAWLGLAAAVLCLYASAAVLTNTMLGRRAMWM